LILSASATEYDTLRNSWMNTLIAAVVSGIEWMNSRFYTKTATLYGNWYDWEIAAPTAITNRLTLLLSNPRAIASKLQGQHLKPAFFTKYLDAIALAQASAPRETSFRHISARVNGRNFPRARDDPRFPSGADEAVFFVLRATGAHDDCTSRADRRSRAGSRGSARLTMNLLTIAGFTNDRRIFGMLAR